MWRLAESRAFRAVAPFIRNNLHTLLEAVTDLFCIFKRSLNALLHAMAFLRTTLFTPASLTHSLCSKLMYLKCNKLYCFQVICNLHLVSCFLYPFSAPFLTLCLNERKKALEETCSRLNYQPYNRQPQQSSENSVSDNFLSPPNGNVSSETAPAFDGIERGHLNYTDILHLCCWILLH